MAYRDIQPPIVGDKQVYRVSGSDKLVDLPTYLGYINENMDLHGASPIFINGVAGETMTIPVATASNSIVISGAITFLQPVVFPTAGTIRKTIQTSEKVGALNILYQATLVTVTSQTGVYPAIGVQVEKLNGNNTWEKLMYFDPPLFYSTLQITPGSGVVGSIGLYTVWPFLKPNSQYRVTALAGVFSSAALPNTGQFKIDATGTNTLEFNAWEFN